MDFNNPALAIIGVDKKAILNLNHGDEELYHKVLRSIHMCTPDVFVLLKSYEPLEDFEIEAIQLGTELGISVIVITSTEEAPLNTVWRTQPQYIIQGEGPSWTSVICEAIGSGQKLQHLLDAQRICS